MAAAKPEAQAPGAAGAAREGSAAHAIRLGLDKNTTVLKGGQRLSLEDLEVGDKVKVSVEDQAGRPIARTITVDKADKAAPTGG